MEEIDDPEKYAKLFREELIEQFGDVPEEVEKKWKAGGGVFHDKYIEYLTALFQLFGGKDTLDKLQRALAEQDRDE